MVNPTPQFANEAQSCILDTFYNFNNKETRSSYKHEGAWETRTIKQKDVVVADRAAYDTANKLMQNIIDKLQKIDPDIKEKISIASKDGISTPRDAALHRVAFSNDALKTIENYNTQFKEKIAPELAANLFLTYFVPESLDWRKEGAVKLLTDLLPALNVRSHVSLRDATSLDIEFNKRKGDYTLTLNGKDGRKFIITDVSIDHLKGIIGIISNIYKDPIEEKRVREEAPRVCEEATKRLNIFMKDTNKQQKVNAERYLFEGPLRESGLQQKDVHIHEAESVDLVFNKEKGDYTLTFNGKNGKSTITVDAYNLKESIELLTKIYKSEVKV